jgi:hypothetical protein
MDKTETWRSSLTFDLDKSESSAVADAADAIADSHCKLDAT